MKVNFTNSRVLFFLILILFIPVQVCSEGIYMTEGDHIMKTDLYRSMSGVNGTGIKVGVISNGVSNYMDAVKTGDLDSSLNVIGSMGDGDEGTAMLEIIHDIAPGATLYFTPVEGGMESFNDAVDKLVAEGCNIICDDVGWLTDPYFQDGEIADHLNSIFSKNPDLIYISAAGNQAQYHFQGTFEDGGNGWNTFSNKKGKTTELPLTVNPGGVVKIFLQWDDSFNSAKNVYELYLIDPRTGDVVSKSPEIQAGKAPPLGYIVYANEGEETVPLILKVKKKSWTSEKKTIELFLLLSGTATDTSYLSPIDSIHGLAAAPEVISVAAAAPLEIPVSEPFSSQGTITIAYPKPVKRSKPDITGIDGVKVSGSGGFTTPFYGTSAAAPHIAGFIALVLSYNKDLSRKDIFNILTKTATDLGDKGWDPVFGNGLPDGEKAYNYLSGLSSKDNKNKNKTNNPVESNIVKLNSTKNLNELPVCPEGFEWSSAERACIKTKIVCEAGFNFDSQQKACIPSGKGECYPGSTWDAQEKACVSLDSCPLKTEWNDKDNACVAIIQGNCPIGYHEYRNSSCIPDTNVGNCYQGSKWQASNNACVPIDGGLPLTNSVTLSSPGVYTIGDDIEGNGDYLLRISSSDVKIEGNGHILKSVPVQIGITPSKPQRGIYIGSDTDTKQLTNITINNLIVLNGYEGISLKNTDLYRITNCTLDSNARGFKAIGSSKGTIAGNKVINNGENGIEFGDGSNFNTIEGNEVNKNLNGIAVLGGEGNLLIKNTCSDNFYNGIFVKGKSQKTVVKNNTCENNGDGGIFIENSNGNTIEGNTADNNMWWGTYLYESSENILQYNKFFDNFRGINLFYADSNIIRKNILANNIESGILFQPSGNNRVSKNTIVNNKGEGIMITKGATSSQRNYIFDNYFLNQINFFIEKNSKPAYIWNICPKPGKNIIGGINVSGNFWGTPDGKGYSQKCVDINKDGFCDQSYVLSNEMKDEYPLKSEKPEISTSPEDMGINLKSVSQNEVNTIFRDGISHTFRYEKDEAIKAFQEVLDKEPQNTEVLMYLSIFYSDIGSFQESIGTIDKAIKIAPYSAELWNAKGNIYLLKMQNYEKAILSYDEAIKINLYDLNSITNKGFSLFNLGRYDEAIKEYSRANTINPKIADTWNKLGNAQLSVGKVTEAISSYDKALALDPDYIFAWNNRGIALSVQENYKDAICSYGMALSLDPSYTSASLGRATALMSLGRYSEAVKDYSDFMKNEPGNPAVAANLTLAKQKSDTSGKGMIINDCNINTSLTSKQQKSNLEPVVSCPKNSVISF